MSAIWIKVLVLIDRRNKVLQARNMTIDAEVSNLENLLQDFKEVREGWDAILNEAKQVADSMKIAPHLPAKRTRKRKRFADEVLEHPPVAIPQAQHPSLPGKKA